MPVGPIDYGRYGNHDMVRIFEEEFRHRLWLDVEAAVAEAEASIDLIPKEAAEDIAKTADPAIVTLERTMEIERVTRHDVAALFEAIAEKCDGPGARWVHFGLTSNDIKDTALGLQLKEAFRVILARTKTIGDTLSKRARETEELVAVGRSHGQHAVPITYGIRFAVWLDEITRHRERLILAKRTVSVGKIAGATGSHAALGTDGLRLQDMVLRDLGLSVPAATTQIVQRDRLGHCITALANLASTLDKIATDLRNLQRTEIGETFEPFAKGRQIGSSAMPHKRNPVTCEKISGLARVVRSLVQPALENVVSWEERDIAHSSTERFIVPQAFILTDYMLSEMNRVIEGMTIDRESVERNMAMSNDLVLSEYVVTLLTRAGLERPKAHEKLRRLSVLARENRESLLKLLEDDPDLKGVISPEDFDVERYFKSIVEVSREIVGRAITHHESVSSEPTE
ncbi:MAG: adenylosuccinate lyase [Candidatus Thorarchaeota archaeon]|nr:MAG: adenylosuccinate lyase [Candidatus Thorarchaeota archaeon]